MDRRKDQDDLRENAILGERFPVSKFTSIGELAPDSGNVVISGEIFLVERWFSLRGSVLLTFGIADDDACVRCEVFFSSRAAATAVSRALKKHDRVTVKGDMGVGRDGEMCVKAHHIWRAPQDDRQDTAAEKHIELHVHTCYSAMDALTKPRELVQRAAQWGMPAVAVTDHGGVQAFPELWKAGKKYGVKIICGVEGYFVDDTDGTARDVPICHICLLAKNKQGLKNLYRIVSASHIRHYNRQKRLPMMPKRLVQTYREGLLVGSACAEGELYQAILQGRPQAELERVASFYDYLEIMPLTNSRFLVENGTVQDDEALQEINKRIAALGKSLGKPVAATCDVHFLEPHEEAAEEAARRILLASGEALPTEHDLPLYFRTTEEVLAEFAYLGEKTCREVVIDGPRRIADRVEEFDLLPEEPCLPKVENSKEELERLVTEQLRRLYGEEPPPVVAQRVSAELNAIFRCGADVAYLAARKLVQGSLEHGYPAGVQGGVGSSLVAYLSGITEIDPLPPHYVCPHCKHTEFIADGSHACGVDLPDRLCPVCGGEYRKDGFDIPMETFFGIPGEEKFPDIDLIFADEYRDRAVEQLREMFGKDRVLRAGSIGTLAHKRARDMVEAHTRSHQMALSKVEKARLATSLVDVKRATGCWPGGYIIISEDVETTDFCPVQWVGEDPDSGELATHFDYYAISASPLKLDLLVHGSVSMLHMLQDLTGVDPQAIPLDDPDTMSLFTSSDILGYTDDPLLGPVGTAAVPEFGTSFFRGMLAKTHPRSFSDLVRLCSFAHGTDVWLQNAHDLILNGTATLSETVSCRDDIMLYLIRQGVEPTTAYQIMEAVRKGKVNRDGFRDGWVEEMQAHGVPQWYIDSMAKIYYLFPKACAVSYAGMAFRIAWFKVHYPLAFYATYFTIRAKDLDPAVLCQGMASVKDRLERVKSKRNAGILPRAAEDAYITLDAVYEFYLRGYDFAPTDVSGSGPLRFQIVDDRRLTLTTDPV